MKTGAVLVGSHCCNEEPEIITLQARKAVLLGSEFQTMVIVSVSFGPGACTSQVFTAVTEEPKGRR